MICSPVGIENEIKVKSGIKDTSGEEIEYSIICNDIAKTSEVIILCHGIFSHKNAHTIRKIAESLKTISHVRFDFRGAGASTGSTTYGGYLEELEDLKYMIDWVRSQGIF